MHYWCVKIKCFIIDIFVDFGVCLACLGGLCINEVARRYSTCFSILLMLLLSDWGLFDQREALMFQVLIMHTKWFSGSEYNSQLYPFMRDDSSEGRKITSRVGHWKIWRLFKVPHEWGSWFLSKDQVPNGRGIANPRLFQPGRMEDIVQSSKAC